MTNIQGADIENHISKCTVCELPSLVIAIHSQTTEIPDCPANYISAWTGYSFIMHTDSGAAGGGQSLMSPGSCIENFRPTPFIECHGLGTCNVFTTALSYWMATIELNDMFRRPRAQTLKSGALTTRVSRCHVCWRSPMKVSPSTSPSEAETSRFSLKESDRSAMNEYQGGYMNGANGNYGGVDSSSSGRQGGSSSGTGRYNTRRGDTGTPGSFDSTSNTGVIGGQGGRRILPEDSAGNYDSRYSSSTGAQGSYGGSTGGQGGSGGQGGYSGSTGGQGGYSGSTGGQGGYSASSGSSGSFSTSTGGQGGYSGSTGGQGGYSGSSSTGGQGGYSGSTGRQE